MKRRQINSLSAMKSVVQFFTENPALLIDRPALKAAVEQLKAAIREIESLELAQSVDTKADTALKGETRTALSKAILKVLAAVAAHAAATNDTRLKMAADVSEYDLKKLRDNSLVLKARATHEIAMEIAPELVIWNVSQADIDALDMNSDIYDAKDPAIKNIKARSKQATADIKTKVDEGSGFMKETLDPMMLPFKISNPSVYGHYLNARTVINTAGGHSKGTAPEDTKTVA